MNTRLRAALVCVVLLLTAATLSARTDNGVIQISAKVNDSWHLVDEVPFGMNFSTAVVDLPADFAGVASVQLRLKSEGGGASHVDGLVLSGYHPDSGTMLTKLLAVDNDVLDTQEIPAIAYNMVPDFSGPSGTLAITARIEPEIISTVPFRFPKINTYRGSGTPRFSYFYKPGSVVGTLALDGELRGEELGEPFFSEYIPVGSGHPQGRTYGWVMDDGTNLYVAIDFTPDNTMDGEKDYASVHIKTPEGHREFRSSVKELSWGLPGFTYTGKVGYQHKVYEFKIPMSEIAIEDGPIHLSFEAYGTATPAAGPRTPDIAYNSLANEYLAVYGQPEGTFGGPLHVKAERLNHLGITQGSVIDIALSVDQTSGAFAPDISAEAAYDPFTDRYLVVWVDDTDDNDIGDIRGRLVSGNGTLFGPVITIGATVDRQKDPDVVFEPSNGRFFVVWEDERISANVNIYGQFVQSDGFLAGANFPVADAPTFATAPVAAVDTINDQILVVFNDARNGAEIYGQLLTIAGIPVWSATASNFIILTRAPDLRSLFLPSLQFNETAGEYLLAVDDDAATDSVMVRRIGFDGTLYDHTFDVDVSVDIDDYEVVNADGANIAVDYNPTTDEYLVAWDLFINAAQQNDLQAKVVDSSLVPGTVQNLGTLADIEDIRPAIAANRHGGNFLVAYFEYDFNTENTALGAAVVGTYSADPRLDWVAANGTEGTATPSGGSNDTFTFEIEYFSATGEAPTVKELWIDVDNSGVYDPAEKHVMTAVKELAAAPLIAPPRGGAIAIGVSILVPLSILLILGFAKRRAGLPKLAAIMLLVSLVVVGCKWWDGTYTLSPGYEAPIDYTTGEVYTVDVLVVASPGDISYKFVFENSIRRATAVGASERRLTILS